MATTSGTVSTYVFTMRKVLEHAYRRAGVRPQDISGEMLETAQDLIYTLTSEWINAGFPLWTRQFLSLGVTIGAPSVVLPLGNVDVIHTYWHTLNPFRGTVTTGAGNVSQLVSGQPISDVVIPSPNPSVTAALGGVTEVDTIGILPGTNGGFTASLQVYLSNDGVTFTTGPTLASTTFVAGQWSYFSFGTTVSAAYVRVTYPGSQSWTLQQLNFGLANGTDLEIGQLNIDDYYNLPNKVFQSDRPNSAWIDRQLNQPVIKIWPTVNANGFYNGYIRALSRRYIQDPGALNNTVETPQRWSEALIWRLADKLLHELPDPTDAIGMQMRTQRIQTAQQEAARAEALAWAEERVVGPIRLTPNIGVYTR